MTPHAPDAAAPARGRLRLVLTTAAVTLAVALAAGDALRAGARGVWRAIAGDDSPAADGDRRHHTCGMHPWVVLPHAGDCPICHMKLEPLDPKKFEAELAIDPVVAQNMGVRVAAVTRGPLVRSVRAVGTVAYDESTVRDVSLKVGGWLERVHLDAVGAPVAVGDPLFALYSPALFSAQEELLAATRGGRAADVHAARTRLAYFDVGEGELDALLARGAPVKALTLVSPWAGVVVEKHVHEGMKVEAGATLYRVADLSRVWVMVSLHEHQLADVRAGQAAVMTLTYLPGRSFEGHVDYVYPTLEAATREVRARLVFPNPEGLLRPGMFAEVALRGVLDGDRVLAPREAVLVTGERQVALVSLGEGRFEPRPVRLGAEGDDGVVEVLEGLAPGERVVTSGQFLLDGEARMRESLARMIRGDLASEQPAVVAAAPDAGPGVPLPASAAAALADALRAAFAIQDTLASDATDGVPAAAGTLATAIARLRAVPLPSDPHFWHHHAEVDTVEAQARALAAPLPLAPAREAFADLSVALVRLVRATGAPPDLGVELQVLHCPMYREDQGGIVWLQPAGPARNPYYGSEMLACFDTRASLPPGPAAAAEAAP